MQQKRGDEGFTLIEIAVALTSTAILAVGVMLVFTTATFQDRDAYETTRTQNVCGSLMEQVEAFEFEELAVFAGNTFSWHIERWTMTISVVQIQPDLLAIETTARVTDDPDSETLRLVTVKAIKDESL
ncbi:MAG: hypothetical protein R3F20_08095 [Planctomycetota bacterium]